MPKTGVYLAELLEWDIRGKTISELTYHSKTNIEMGVFYLNKLLKKFRNNYKLATCAYNMGPGWVRKQLRNKRPVGIKNKYFSKVSKYYHKLVKEIRKEFKQRVPPYQNTYVARWKKRNKGHKFKEILPFGLPKDFASSQFPTKRSKILKNIFIL
jgi:soluble lytic murein transglycosylase